MWQGRGIDRQGQVGEQLAEEKPGARPAVDQHGVLAESAQSETESLEFTHHIAQQRKIFGRKLQTHLITW